jgi:hypothetical protein
MVGHGIRNWQIYGAWTLQAATSEVILQGAYDSTIQQRILHCKGRASCLSQTQHETEFYCLYIIIIKHSKIVTEESII